MRKQKLVFLLLFTILLSLFAGCSNTTTINDSQKNQQPASVSSSNYPQVVTDSYQRQVQLETEPKRVVSTAPSITETIFALDKANVLVGRTEYCDYPEQVKDIASIGTIMEPNIEKIAELKPDIVIASTHFSKENVKKLEDLSIKVLVFVAEESFEGTYQIIEKLGTVLNAKDKADKIISDMKNKVQEIQNKVKDKPRPNVYYVVSYGKAGDFTAGKDTFIGQMIEMAGGKNIADDVTGWAYSIEKLTAKKPDLLICSKYFDAKKGIESTNGYKQLDAVKKGKLFEIDNNLIDRQGPRNADGLYELAKIIHPDEFK